MATQIQLRRDTLANWISNNPILAEGEIGVETDTKRLKAGDGSTPWNNLCYIFENYYVKKVDAISNLLQLDTTLLENGSFCFVGGYHSKGDGGGGMFYWDANEDKANHNGGTIIDPTQTFPSDWSDTVQQETWFTASGTGNGCWKRVVGDYVTPEMFGAKGDGVTDDTRALINTAVFSVILSNRDKHYIVKDTLVIENSYLNLNNSLLEFQTTGSTLALQVRNNSKVTSGTVLVNGDSFDSGGQYGCPIVIGDYGSGSGYSNIEVDNLLVDTNKNNGNGIMVTGDSHNIKISNIKSVSSSTIGRVVLIHWGNSDDPTSGTKHPHDIIVENIVGENLSHYDTDTSVVFISGAYNLDISNIRALDCSLRAAVISYAGDYGNYYANEDIKDAIMSNIKIKNVFGRVINDNSSLIKIDHKSTSAPTNNILPGCYIQNCYGKGNGSSSAQSGININNCKGGIIENCRAEGFINGLATGESVIRLHIKGGEYYNNYNHGIRLHNGTAPPEHCTVKGVKAYANGLDTNGYYAGIFIGISKHCIARDNIAGELDESTQAYGIRVDNAAVGAVIVDNHCLGATTVAYSIGAGTTYEVCKEFHGNTVDSSVTVPVQAGVNPQIVHTLYRGNYKKRVCLGSNAPSSGSWNTSDIIYDESPAGGGYLGWVCVRSGEAAPAWTASTSKDVGDKVVPTTDNGYYYECTVAGTTGSSEPTWPTNIGDTVTDGSVTWECKGTAALFKEFGQISS